MLQVKSGGTMRAGRVRCLGPSAWLLYGGLNSPSEAYTAPSIEPRDQPPMAAGIVAVLQHPKSF